MGVLVGDGHRQEHFGAVHVEGALPGEGAQVPGEAPGAHQFGIERGLGPAVRPFQKGPAPGQAVVEARCVPHDVLTADGKAGLPVPWDGVRPGRHLPAKVAGHGFQLGRADRGRLQPRLFGKAGGVILGAPQGADPPVAPQQQHRQVQPKGPQGGRLAVGRPPDGPAQQPQRPQDQQGGPRLADAEGQRVAQGAQPPLEGHRDGLHPPVHGGPVGPCQPEQGQRCQRPRQPCQGRPVGRQECLHPAQRSKVVRRVVCQLSPGARMAAAARLRQEGPSASAAGRLCQGSMQTNRMGLDAALQIRV